MPTNHQVDRQELGKDVLRVDPMVWLDNSQFLLYSPYFFIHADLFSAYLLETLDPLGFDLSIQPLDNLLHLLPFADLLLLSDH
jgi:hypothetical protein